MKGRTRLSFRKTFGIVPLILTGLLSAMPSSALDVYLVAKEFDKGLPSIDPLAPAGSAVAIRMWGFGLDLDSDGDGVGDCFASGAATASTGCMASTPTTPGPRITLPGDDGTLRVYLSNLLPEPVSFILPGQMMPSVTAATPVWTDGTSGARTGPDQRVRSFTAEAAPGGTQLYAWDPAMGTGFSPGTYLYQSGTHASLQNHMGLYGAATRDAPKLAGEVVEIAYRRADGSAIQYHQEVLLLYSEIDKTLHDLAAAGDLAGASAKPLNYSPDYFLVNGEPFDPTDPNSQRIVGLYTKRDTLLRLLNAGLQFHVPMFQQLDMSLIAEDGSVYPYPREQYTADLPPGKTKDAIIRADLGGSFTVHDQHLDLTTGPTASGGMLSFLDFTPFPNLLVNGDFADGKAPWVFYSNGSASLKVVAEEAKINIVTSGTNVQLYQKGFATQGDTTYRLTFDALHSAGKAIELRYFKHVSPYTNYGLFVRKLTLSPTMRTYSIEFTTPPGSQSDGRLMFKLNQGDVDGSLYRFDNVVLWRVPTGPCGNGLLDPAELCDGTLFADAPTCGTQGFDGGTLACNATCDGLDTSGCFVCGNGIVEGAEQCDDGNAVDTDACSNSCTANILPNVLANGDFSAGKAPWKFSSNGTASFSVVGGEARIPIVTSGTAVQLYQFGFTLKGNTTYVVSFRGMQTAQRWMTLQLLLHVSPYTNLGLNQSVKLSNTMTAYSFEFTTTPGDKLNPRFRVWLASGDDDGSTYTFDDFVISEAVTATCGDGLLDPGEACDDGAANSDTLPDACRTDCTAATCGDHVLDTGEICDGTALAGETCATQGRIGGVLACALTCDTFDISGCTSCGDGILDPGEVCDDGPANSDTLADACRTTCMLPVCGDGVIDTGEACDAGPANSDTLANACRTSCMLPACGDGILDTGEACDDGAANSDTLADACRTSCTPAVCGDGVLDTGEACDDGAANSDTLADACRTSCVVAVCGDGAVDSGEQCDDGNTTDTDACSNLCTSNVLPNILANGDFAAGKAPWKFSSNGTASFGVVGGEARIPIVTSGTAVQLYQFGFTLKGNTTYVVSFRGMQTAQRWITLQLLMHSSPYTNLGLNQSVKLSNTMTAYSFEFTTTPGDKPNPRFRAWLASGDNDGSTYTFDDFVISEAVAGVCGDGLLDPGEACDDGAANSDTLPDACRTDCTAATCGDQILDTGEICDGTALAGETCASQGRIGGVLACAPTCDTFDLGGCTSCGDGILDPGEACDNGAANSDTDTDACRTTCVLPACGDDVVDTGEACDDGPANSDTLPDACRTSCLAPICGDNVVDTGEQCDDGNAVDGDTCSNLCTLNVLPNLLTNGDFAGGKRPWKFNTNGTASFAVTGGEAKVSITTSGSSIQLYQANFALKGDTMYRLSFRGKHSAQRWIKVQALNHQAPYQNLGLEWAFRLRTSMNPFTVEFTTPPGDIPNARFRFWLANADVDGSVFGFDDVVLEEVP